MSEDSTRRSPESALIDRIREAAERMTEADWREQRISFALGNLNASSILLVDESS